MFLIQIDLVLKHALSTNPFSGPDRTADLQFVDGLVILLDPERV